MGNRKPINKVLKEIYRFEYEKLGIGQSLRRAEVKELVGIVNGRTVSVDTPNVDPYYEIMLDFEIENDNSHYRDDYDHKLWTKDTQCYYRLLVPQFNWTHLSAKELEPDSLPLQIMFEMKSSVREPYSYRLTMKDRNIVNQAMRTFRKRFRKS